MPASLQQSDINPLGYAMVLGKLLVPGHHINLDWQGPTALAEGGSHSILVQKRFRSEVNIHRTRSFPGAVMGSSHILVMMTFRIRLKKARKPNQPRLRFDLEKLRDPDVACTFQALIGGNSLHSLDLEMRTWTSIS